MKVTKNEANLCLHIITEHFGTLVAVNYIFKLYIKI